MPQPFIHEDFLLDSPPARQLYHEYAAGLPIIDYHCHLPPEHIACDQSFANLAQMWLAGDHYKWRAMRANGVGERYCTGNASDWEKFEQWAATVPKLLRNPLYHWTHMELQRPFGIADRLLNPSTARGIWEECNAQLGRPEFTSRGILRQFNVTLVCTTDDPTDDLRYHQNWAKASTGGPRMCPTWRPDKALAVEDPAAFNGWLDRLEAAADVEICNFAGLLDALRQRQTFFHDQGCRMSDHGLDTIYAADYTQPTIDATFEKLRGSRAISPAEAAQYKSAMLYELAIMDHARGWTQQFHLGAMRNNSSRMFVALGPDTGFDSIGDEPIVRPLARLLDRLDHDDCLGRTIVYNSNPRDNEALATLLASFCDGSLPGKMQFGSAWWFLDHLEGMSQQIETLSHMGLLSHFVGMVTDSRSFLSYTRHEYFRRLLCNILGNDIQRGRLPHDMALVGGMIQDICHHNAARYLAFDMTV